MAESSTSRRSDCPLACTLDLIGDRWTLLVVRDLALGKQHFDEFLASPERIATNILSDRLRLLCEAGLAKKRTREDDRRRQCYELTERGLELAALLGPLAQWGARYFPGTKMAETFPAGERRRAGREKLRE